MLIPSLPLLSSSFSAYCPKGWGAMGRWWERKEEGGRLPMTPPHGITMDYPAKARHELLANSVCRYAAPCAAPYGPALPGIVIATTQLSPHTPSSSEISDPELLFLLLLLHLFLLADRTSWQTHEQKHNLVHRKHQTFHLFCEIIFYLKTLCVTILSSNNSWALNASSLGCHST